MLEDDTSIPPVELSVTKQLSCLVLEIGCNHLMQMEISEGCAKSPTNINCLHLTDKQTTVTEGDITV